MKSISYIKALAAMMLFMVSCTDDLTGNFSWSEGECSLSMDVGFTSFGTALETRASNGDLIGDVSSLQVLFYSNVGTDGEEGSAKLKYVFTGTTIGGQSGMAGDEEDANGVRSGTFSFTPTDANRTDADAPDPTTGISESTNTTKHMEFRLGNLQRGHYRIYVVANMPSDFNAKADAKTVEALRNYPLHWDADNISANNAMFGYFEVGESSNQNVARTEAPAIALNGPMKMHAWMKRAVSKVTVAFDGTNLADNVWIYIKSVQIKDIPQTCLLGARNTPASDDDLVKEEPESAKIIYSTATGASGQSITTGNPYFPRPSAGQSVEQWRAEQHAPNSLNSLFFFENAQEDGRDDPNDEDGSYKPQTDTYGGNIGDGNGLPDDYDRHFDKDSRPYGTYIEVKAYYVNNNNFEVGRGDIVYRFMLGKNVTTSFDAERSIHYKLTLKFNNNANDVDWHIEIDEDPGIYVPETYYVSYEYNTETLLPVRIRGELVGRLRAEIVENKWEPEEAGTYPYFKDQVYIGTKPYRIDSISDSYGRVTNGICNGFLQLRQLPAGEELSIGDAVGFADLQNDNSSGGLFNENYWYSHGDPQGSDYSNLGYREYYLNDPNNVDGDNLGKYECIVSTINGVSTTNFSIPLYTRALKLVGTAGYSGANPYYGSNRKARLRFTATIRVNGMDREYKSYTTILQRPRIENPAGVWRRWNNSAPFHVVAMTRENETTTDFIPFESIGPWSAEITLNSGGTDWITLEGGRSSTGTFVQGATDSRVDFWIRFNGQLPSANAIPQCAVITVLYHNYSCTHMIFVRRGYAPIAMTTGGARWHCFNLYSTGQETLSPCEEGSLFRRGNLTYAISETNNVPENFNKVPSGNLDLAPNGSRSWANITPLSGNNSQFRGVISLSTHTELSDRSGRLPTESDWNLLLNRENVQVTYGILYADGATECTQNSDAFSYTRASANDEGNSSRGMRGCFVYNRTTGVNMFLPISKTGYGRRVAVNSGMETPLDEQGTLRYAGRKYDMSRSTTETHEKNAGPIIVRVRPLFKNIYMNEGALYWNEGSSGSQSFDINYRTYDFAQYGANLGDGAAYVRLVSD